MLLDMDGIVQYSDELSRVHIGIVVDNVDPKKIGRIKCNVEFLLDTTIPQADLPWVYSTIDSPNKLDVPEIGDKVKLIFRNKDIYQPEYIGNYHTTVNHNTDFDTDYPNTIGYSRSGFKALYNKVSQLFQLVLPNGNYIKIDKDGNNFINIIKDFISTMVKFTLTTTGDALLTIGGKFDVEATGNAVIKSSAEATFSGTSKTTLGDSGSITYVNGTQVLIAGGGVGIALVGSMVTGMSPTGPVIGNVQTGSSKVLAPM